MSLIAGKRFAIGRAERELRDDRFFVVAAEDTYAPDQYFNGLAIPRVKVLVIPTPVGSGHSAPVHVVERLKEAHARMRERGEIQTDDEFWVLVDTDHHFKPSHIAGTLDALRAARDSGFFHAVSDPCFETWLLLHHEAPQPGIPLSNPDQVETRLRQVLGRYNKRSIDTNRFTLEGARTAIARARALEADPDDLASHRPASPGTRVYRLMERVVGGRGS
jgi:hypothetical protein